MQFTNVSYKIFKKLFIQKNILRVIERERERKRERESTNYIIIYRKMYKNPI